MKKEISGGIADGIRTKEGPPCLWELQEAAAALLVLPPKVAHEVAPSMHEVMIQGGEWRVTQYLHYLFCHLGIFNLELSARRGTASA